MHIYRRGDRGPAVAEIRARLDALGLLPAVDDNTADAVYDESCDHAVRGFQQQRGLSVDGMVGPETYRALDEARWSLGDRVLYQHVGRPYVGDDVMALQARLQDFGFDVGRCDGIFGRRTDAALREFQRSVGLPADGTLGPTSLRALAQLQRAVVGGAPGRLREHEELFRAGVSLQGKLVIVDPAHGGPDRGWVDHNLAEADVVFDLATRLEGRLAAAGAFAFLTRNETGNPSEEERATFANAADADLLVSLHVDGALSARCEGVATYYFGSSPERSSAVGERLAELVQRELVAHTDLLDDRTHRKTWELLRLTRMPTVRVELGYLTNRHDARRLAQAEFRDTVADALLGAIQRLYLPPEQDPGTGQLRLPQLQPA
ncbi:MAG: N-acetylmuramoyl-L-alanine amidase [Mycobacteriales bacterium]|nr:N-acetylmuramoyl-L-alanine amidase [Frankia sp.]